MSSDPYAMIKSDNPEEVRAALVRIRQLAQARDERAEKHVRSSVVLGCPHELEAAVAWQIQMNVSGVAYAPIMQDDIEKIKGPNTGSGRTFELLNRNSPGPNTGSGRSLVDCAPKCR